MTDADIDRLRSCLTEVHRDMHLKIEGMSHNELIDLARKTLVCSKVGPNLTERQEEVFLLATGD